MKKNIDDLKKYVGLKELRQLLDLSQEELAVAAGVTTGHLASIEGNGRKFALKTAEKVSIAIKNMLTKAIDYGNAIKEGSVDNKEIIGRSEELNTDFSESQYNGKEVSISPDLLIISHEVSFFPESLQDTAYELMVSSEVNERRLSMMREEGVDLTEEDILKIENKYKQEPKAIINNILQDKCYRDGYEKVLEELRGHMRKSSGFFLSSDQDS